MSTPPTLQPPTPGVGARRQHFPKLPLSAFSPTSSGRAEGAPAPPSPSSLIPSSIIDAHAAHGSTSDLSASYGTAKLEGVVLALSSADGADKVLAGLSASSIPVKAVTIPLVLDKGAPAGEPPSFLHGASVPISVSITVSKTSPSPSLTQGIAWALDAGLPLEVDVVETASDEAQGYEWLAELLSSAQEASQRKPTPIVLSNILPPHSSIDLPIVKLLSHPAYLAYQGHVGSLSLVPNTFLKFIPPVWDQPGEGEGGLLSESQVREWKRRVKMYLGPAVEAFGDSRILFGTSPALSDGKIRIKPSDWYALARESIAEVGVEQEGIDSIFAGNATAVYAEKTI